MTPSIRLAPRLVVSLLMLATFSRFVSAAPRSKNNSNAFFGERSNHLEIRHVFLIVPENEGYDTTFGPNSKARYLSQTLTSHGVLLNQYYGTGHVSLDNYIAMLSGQAARKDRQPQAQ